MANTIQIKRSTNNTIPNSNISGGTLTAGELGYSYSSDDGSGDEAGLGKLFIGHADGLGGTRAAVIIGGSYFTKMLDHANGTLTASSAVLTDNNSHVDVLKTTSLYIGTSGSATQVTSSAAELNKLDGVTATSAELNILAGVTADSGELNKLDGCTASTTQLNYLDVTVGQAYGGKAVVLDSDKHIDLIKTSALWIGASGSATQVTASAAELNLLDGITVIDTDLSTVAGTHTTLASALAIKTYVDNNLTGLEVKDSVKVATTANLNTTYNNGTAGVGATLTNNGAKAAINIDGVALSANDRVLVKDQTGNTANGIYTVTDIGSGSTNWVLTRSTDTDTAAELNSGVFFFCEGGTTNADNGYVMTQDSAITFGTTHIIFAQFSGTGQITTGDGLSKTGNTMQVNTGTGITITSDNVVIDTAWPGQAAITTVGTIGTGTWNATAISATKGGTGLDTSSSTGVGIVTSGTWTTPAQLTVGFGGTGASSFTSNGILYGNGTNAIQVTAAGTDGYFLKSNSGTPAWTNVIDGGTF
tara:strand:+ start:795 stop:2387 length:1593 start_codon:yes stop_codon:yes gene_type:complete